MYVCMYIYIFIQIYIYIYLYLYFFIYIYIYMNICIYFFTYIYIYMYVCMYVCMYVSLHVCMYTHLHKDKCIRIDPPTHIDSNTLSNIYSLQMPFNYSIRSIRFSQKAPPCCRLRRTCLFNILPVSQE